MFKTSWLMGLLLIVTSSDLSSEDQGKADIALNLLCSITFSNFDNIGHTTKIKEVTLTEIKHKPGGMKIVTQTSDYEVRDIGNIDLWIIIADWDHFCSLLIIGSLFARNDT